MCDDYVARYTEAIMQGDLTSMVETLVEVTMNGELDHLVEMIGDGLMTVHANYNDIHMRNDDMTLLEMAELMERVNRCVVISQGFYEDILTMT